MAVGDTIHFAKGQKTFVDFLGRYVAGVLGERWGNDEIKKPLGDRHQILQWYDALCAQQRKYASRPEGEIQTMPLTGLMSAYYGLAYNLYLLQHNAELQSLLIRRLKRAGSFYAAYYETFVAAWFILAGYNLAIENEQDPTSSHVEFVATRHGRSYSVEAKTRKPNKANFDVGNQLYNALRKETEQRRFVFIDANVDAGVDPEAFVAEVTSAVRGREPKLTIKGQPAPVAYVFVTNQPYHTCLDEESLPRILLSLGFKIPDFGHDVLFSSFIEAYRARERHADAHAVQDAFKNYQFPTTFDGELPEFAFAAAERRFKIGGRYDLGGGVVATLTNAIVAEEERKAILCFHTDDDEAPILTADLSDAELGAYKEHPETFFGQLVQPGGKSETPMDLFDFFLNSYKETPRLRLLELMKGAPDLDRLEQLPVDELRLEYAERTTRAAIAMSST